MEKIIRKFGRLATRTAKALHDCEEGTHRFHSHPSYYYEGVTHEVVSISVRRGGFDIFLQEDDPCGFDSIYFPVREHMRRSAELLADPARHDDMLATLNSEIRILLTFLKEYIEDTLDSINEELKGHPEDEPNGWEPDFEKRLVSFEFTVMNDKYWTDIPFDTLKAEYGLKMSEYARIVKELQNPDCNE